jgi:hypothetical protein
MITCEPEIVGEVGQICIEPHELDCACTTAVSVFIFIFDIRSHFHLFSTGFRRSLSCREILS